ncbi:N2,N2-dimethyl guanosine tRNA methyltransferase [Ordospora pajunii]|uniref:N2,N2-dimethyl guanosine tRNA methyltransferase n=1 Tax=Ordospora pajunii TaxID=3039483 RepID=UPI0029528A3B|nr:N2,N2-dimethyl guanosine tRNA methyltransferase [Ordospora pajunii]KAH9410907.1 N2,N2-dimethyl guanosine tRNA methyltransferase [Ordospora pajunii]
MIDGACGPTIHTERPESTGAHEGVPNNDCMKITESSTIIFKDEHTFFNPAQKLNRDMSVELIRECFRDKESFRVLDAMSATGLRGIRYLNEIHNSVVYMNDISECSVSAIRQNLELNGFTEVESFMSDIQHIRARKTSRANIVKADCNSLMALLPCFFDVIDIDPFGSCSEYIDNAIRSIKHKGVLCLTATDKGVLCSNEKKCQIKYSTRILRGVGMNEIPLRTIVSLVSRQASKFGSSVEPLLSVSVDFYVRVFVRILKRNPRAVIDDNRYVFVCRCQGTAVIDGDEISSTCSNCGKSMRLCGPFWKGQLHDADIVQKMLESVSHGENKRLLGLLRYIKQEAPTMLYYELPSLCSNLKINTMKRAKMMNALANMGYLVSYTHCEVNAIKSNAPVEVVNKILLANELGDADKQRQMGVCFDENECVRTIEETEFFKGMMCSGMGPLGLPKRNTKNC